MARLGLAFVFGLRPPSSPSHRPEKRDGQPCLAVRGLSRRGFTLIEALVVCGVLGLAMTIGFLIFSRAGDSQARLTATLHLQDQARRASDLLLEEIRQATEVVIPALGETSNFLVVKDAVNNFSYYYAEKDVPGSERDKATRYRLIRYSADASGVYDPTRERILVASLKTVGFTALAHDSVVMTATLADAQREYQFLINIGLMNPGDLE